MRRKPSCVVPLVVALLVGGGAAGGQDSPGAGPKKARTAEDYKPRTLKEVVARAHEETGGRGDEGGQSVVRGDILPSRVRVTYAGSARPLPRAKKDTLLLWAKRYAGYPEGFAAPYQTEMLFKEDGAPYWLAVRKEAAPRFEKELKPGEAVDLYLIRLGAAKVPGGWEGLLLVEDFRKPQ